MSKLPEQAVREFAELYKQEYGIELGSEDAADRAHRFLNLYMAVLGDCGESVPENERSP
jgi:hypothetical protein